MSRLTGLVQPFGRRVIDDRKAGDETTGLHYVYDAWNRPVAAYEDDDDGVFEPTTDDALTAAYEYDGTNRRITKTLADDTGVEYFYNQKWQILEERAVDGEGVLTAVDQYVWSPRYIDAPAVRYHDGNGDCDTSTDAGDTIRYYAGDANYNVTTTVTYGYGNTSTTEHYVYSAYGEATLFVNSASGPVQNGDPRSATQIMPRPRPARDAAPPGRGKHVRSDGTQNVRPAGIPESRKDSAATTRRQTPRSRPTTC